MTGLVPRLRNMRISRKLSLGFGLVLLLVALATALSVVRFMAIRDVYQKTNLVYDINIEVFQAKINRLKYFYSGDDKARETMVKYVQHARELTAQAQALTWAGSEKNIINDIDRALAGFSDSIAAMGTATQQMTSLRASLDAMSAKEEAQRFGELIRTPVSDPEQAYKIYDLLFAISSVRDHAWALRLSGNDAAQQALDQRYSAAQTQLNALMSELDPALQAPFQALWSDTTRYRDLSKSYYASWNQLKAAEDSVKIAGDQSSASIRQLIALVKTQNDELAYNSSTAAIIIGALAVLFGLLVAFYITCQITRPLTHNLALAERIASGDLSSEIKADRSDELGQLTGAMGGMNARLRAIIGDVRQSVSRVSHAASDIATGNSDLSSRTEQQAAAVVQTAASMEQLTATVKNNADNARHASKIAAEASQTASQGGEVVRDVVKTMGEISASSQKIADITAVINSIAFQTNILALNAAVEAARAGEQGRGFAVVASEVRSLASRSSQAAKDIAQLINESVNRIQTGSERAARAGETIEQVVSSVTRVNDIMGEISSASEEQSRGIEQISRAVSELDATTQQNAQLVMASSTSAQALEEQASLLSQLVATFRLAEQDAPGKPTRAAAAQNRPVASAPAPKRGVTLDDGWTTF
ncbi:methyl-accepting chemotaxis protein [Franconibacter helveticus]|uniref:methyl-accepting chemotaxis protein n=1 Tax=Franconibacter helveticus TaxID=357240 RepID=UPI0029151C92|nr:methyl-accepting chemotaxis protein [Franconibacter helveticus]MDU6924136.1 methyl-accepting chemotaxis protein [Franconibacter helveticus]